MENRAVREYFFAVKRKMCVKKKKEKKIECKGKRVKREKKSLAGLTKGSCPSTMASRSSVLVPEMTFTGAGCRILSALRTLVPSCSLA